MINEEIEEYIEELLKIDSSFKMWTDSNKDYILSPKEKQFGKINIIDFFGGKEPVFIDKKFMTSKQSLIIMLPTFVLDSNVVGALHGFITNSSSIKEELKGNAKSFIDSLILNKEDRFYDISPIFYILECILKNVDSSYVIDCLKSIIKIQMLDYKIFKESQGKLIKKDLSLEKEYLLEHGTFDIDIIANKVYKSFITDKKSIVSYKSMVNYIYMLLLKIAQVNLYENSRTPLEKINIIKDFYTKEIGAFSAREILISIYYLNNNIGSFIPINKKNINEILKGIYNSAIDISLLRMTEFFLHLGDRDKINNLMYPVTIETHLIKIGNACNFKSLYSIGDKFFTTFEANMTMIERSKDYEKILDNSKYFKEESFLKRFSKDLLKPEIIENKIRDIELSIIQIKSS